MRLSYDPAKRARALAERGLDFAAAGAVFAGDHLTLADDRQDYGEDRYITIGSLEGRMVVLVWTDRGHDRRIISMRKANEREQQRYASRLGGPG